MSHDVVDPDTYITLRVHALNSILLQIGNHYHSHISGLNFTEVRLILLIRSHPGLTVNELVKLSFTERTIVSKSITQLTQRGLVIRCSENGDGRRYKLSLTRQGSVIAEKTNERAMEGIKSMMSVLTPHEKEVLDVALQKITYQAQKDLEKLL